MRESIPVVVRGSELVTIPGTNKSYNVPKAWMDRLRYDLTMSNQNARFGSQPLSIYFREPQTTAETPYFAYDEWSRKLADLFAQKYGGTGNYNPYNQETQKAANAYNQSLMSKEDYEFYKKYYQADQPGNIQELQKRIESGYKPTQEELQGLPNRRPAVVTGPTGSVQFGKSPEQLKAEADQAAREEAKYEEKTQLQMQSERNQWIESMKTNAISNLPVTIEKKGASIDAQTKALEKQIQSLQYQEQNVTSSINNQPIVTVRSTDPNIRGSMANHLDKLQKINVTG